MFVTHSTWVCRAGLCVRVAGRARRALSASIEPIDNSILRSVLLAPRPGG
ncbi:MAG: hypothetical protein H6741_28595 [Alphaproteobacteria bacterium]|nr:hypothetical protein [Alphaproteobacteria bacterium]MCB9796677.1 hypothetical protein [Alphaproteobacteria bacterium]